MTTGLAQFVEIMALSSHDLIQSNCFLNIKAVLRSCQECSVIKKSLKSISDGSLIKGVILSVADLSDDDAITIVSISALKVERSTSHLDIYLF